MADYFVAGPFTVYDKAFEEENFCGFHGCLPTAIVSLMKISCFIIITLNRWSWGNHKNLPYIMNIVDEPQTLSPQMFYHIQYVTEKGRFHLYTTILRDTEAYQSLVLECLTLLRSIRYKNYYITTGCGTGYNECAITQIFLICNWISCNWDAIHEGNYCPRK